MTIAVAHSETDEGKAALAAAVEEARHRAQSLAVLWISDGDEHDSTTDPALRTAVEGELRAIGQTASGPDALDWELHAAAAGNDWAGAVVDLANEVDAEVLVIGAKRRTPVGKFLMGSMAQRVILDAAMPVLVVKVAE